MEHELDEFLPRCKRVLRSRRAGYGLHQSWVHAYPGGARRWRGQDGTFPKFEDLRIEARPQRDLRLDTIVLCCILPRRFHPKILKPA